MIKKNIAENKPTFIRKRFSTVLPGRHNNVKDKWKFRRKAEDWREGNKWEKKASHAEFEGRCSAIKRNLRMKKLNKKILTKTKMKINKIKKKMKQQAEGFELGKS